jgi:hypothetical protein
LAVGEAEKLAANFAASYAPKCMLGAPACNWREVDQVAWPALEDDRAGPPWRVGPTALCRSDFENAQVGSGLLISKQSKLKR